MPNPDKGMPAETTPANGEDLLKSFLPDDAKDTKDRYQSGGESPSKEEAPKKDSPAK